jgi:DNA-directed RNA polymerase subunit E'/Rpb7
MFREVRSKLHLKLLPSSLANVRAAVLKELSAMLLRIEPTLGGVPLSFKAMKIEGDSAAIFEDQPQIHVKVAVTFLLFAPEEGSVISGIVNNLADDSVGLLILNTFNAVIPKNEMPKTYSFDYGASVWKSKTSGDTISIGSELKIHCRGMRTTDQGLIQVLAALDSISESAPITGTAKPKKSKKSKTVPNADEDDEEPSAAKPKKAAQAAASPAASPAPVAGKGKAAAQSAGDAPAAAKKSKTKASSEPEQDGEKKKKKKARAGAD